MDSLSSKSSSSCRSPKLKHRKPKARKIKEITREETKRNIESKHREEEDDPTLQDLIMECKDLQRRIDALRNRDGKNYFKKKLKKDRKNRRKRGNKHADFPIVDLMPTRNLTGHYGKIYALHWGREPRILCTASQDGTLIIWNALKCHKLDVIPLSSGWITTCAISPSGKYVASAGLDDVCTLYESLHTSKKQIEEMKRPMHMQLEGHDAYISCCRFYEEGQLLTSSGDTTCIMWNLERQQPVTTFRGHEGDVMCVDIAPDLSSFVTGSCDQTCKIFDIRAKPKPVMSFYGHAGDINSVRFFPDNNAFASGSDDATCAFNDMRSQRRLNVYSRGTLSCVSSVDFSTTGMFLFSGYDDFTVSVWDTLSGNQLQRLEGHGNRVSMIGVNSMGKALATASWDATVKIWA